jgi:hypothetical protein
MEHMVKQVSKKATVWLAHSWQRVWDYGWC